MSEVLEKLFGSKVRLRLLRFFLLNSQNEYTFNEIVNKNKINKKESRSELNNLVKIKFLKSHRKGRFKYYKINLQFSFYPELESLLVKSNIFPQSKSLGKIKNIGNVKLAIISGIFLNYPKSRADLLIVADNVSRKKLNNVIANLEAEIGKEIGYMLLSTEELNYRLNMLDRFLFDFLKGPHEEVINRLPKLKRVIAGIKK